MWIHKALRIGNVEPKVTISLLLKNIFCVMSLNENKIQAINIGQYSATQPTTNPKRLLQAGNNFTWIRILGELRTIVIPMSINNSSLL